MKRWILGGALAAALVLTGAARLRANDDSFKTRIFGNITNVVVRGVSSAGAPWVEDNSHVKLMGNGDMRVQIRGLVLASGLTAAGVPQNPAVVGTNPVPFVRIAVTWAVPASVSPTAVFVQETPVLPLDLNGDLTARLNIGPPPMGAERPVILVRAANPMTGVSGVWIASSDFPADFGASQPRDD